MKARKFFAGAGTVLLCVALASGLAACKQSLEQNNPQLPLPEWTAERPCIDVEQLLDSIDLGMDISQLTVSELRVLRNAFAARQGYIFMSADLRSIFSQTTWYDSLMWARWESDFDWSNDDVPETPDTDGPLPEEQRMKAISYTDEELAFIDRVKAREKELLEKNFDMDEGWMVNVDNVVNLFQKEGLGWDTRDLKDDRVTMRSAPVTKGQRLRSKLGELGFAIVPSDYDQLFQVYENNDYHNFPNFITTDLFLQTFHLYFDVALRRIEEAHFAPQLEKLCKEMHLAMLNEAAMQQDAKVKLRAEHAAAFFAIGHALLTGSMQLSIPESQKADVATEMEQIESLDNSPSDFLEYHDAYFMYSLFRPRGHYTRNEVLSRYFTAMMWLQTAPFCVNNPMQVIEAALIGQTLSNKPQLKKLYEDITKPIDFLMGLPDNGNVLQVYELTKKQNLQLTQMANDKSKQQAFQKELESLLKKQVRIEPKHQLSSQYKINLMPQRFQPDALVLQEMVDYDNKPTKRAVPKGLDVMAAIGMPFAERILLDELNEQERWDQFNPTLEEMKKKSDMSQWEPTVTNEWMKALTTLKADRHETTKPEGKHPDYFMLSPQWDKKNLNAALASWAELKHDAILYAKQPMGAECGGGGPEEPICMGYVEPNVKFWQAALDLITMTKEVLDKFNISTEDVDRYTESLFEEAEFFLNMSKKELQGKRLSDEEYGHIEYIGANFEYLSLDMLREPEQWLSEWNDIDGADKKVAVVADVYTANAMNNPEKSVLYEAVGPADEIYVIVEIDGYLYLTRGAVFSYREFTRPLSEPRLTDEDWQQLLEKYPAKGLPEWMEPLKVPAEEIPADNELIFYSTGC